MLLTIQESQQISSKYNSWLSVCSLTAGMLGLSTHFFSEKWSKKKKKEVGLVSFLESSLRS